MKKINLSPLAAASLSLLLSACGGGGGEGDDGTTASAAPATRAEAADEPAATDPAAALAVDTAAPPELEAAVRESLAPAHAQQALLAYDGVSMTPVVEVHRRSGDGAWMFGGAYYPIPSNLGGAAPVNALFVARLDAGAWTVSLEDTPAFAAMLQEAPTGLASDEERQIFSTRDQNLQQRLDATALAAGQDLGLSMPYARNDPSWGTWGVHGDTGSSRPYNSIDFKAGDGRVLASRGGVAYKFCTNGRWPFIKVVHDNGFTTGYYHLRNVPSIANGQRVAEGDFLGQTGVELPCGGSADGNHVHWSLWRGGSDGRAEPVNGKLIGGWTWFEGSKPYSGYAERNGKRVAAGSNGLVNHGHGGTTPAPSTTPSGSPCTGTGCKRYTGSIASAGRYATHPGDNGFQHAGGPLKGWLEGPSGANFDLILGRYNDRTGQWDRAAVSEGPGSKERVSHDAAAGKYRWRISGIAGKGSYTLWTQP